MLDRATLEKLSRTPEKNAPTLNVALAEEGVASVLLSLARSPAVGPEALAVLDARIAGEGAAVGCDAAAPADEAFERVDGELDRLLAAHPRAADDTRDAVMARHPGEAWFVLAAAAHPRATLVALERAIDWPSASPVHDRLWLALLDAARCRRSRSRSGRRTRRRCAASGARIGREPALLERLAATRRARCAARWPRTARRRRCARCWPRATRRRGARPRRTGAIGAHEAAASSDGRGWVDSARFVAALRAMESGGVLAPT
ncbi:MAG: hypothetical protein WKG00_28935 [Polyangiaceae bacterium]